LEPGGIVLLQLRESAGNGAQAAGRGDVGIAPAIARSHVILKRIYPERNSVSPVADIEPGRIVDVDPERIEHVAPLVADAARNVVAGIAGAAKGRPAGAVMICLGLVVVGTIAVERHIPVPE